MQLSFVWRLIERRPAGASRRAMYLTLVFGGLLFSLPRFGEGWFVWAALALPFSLAAMLELIKYLLAALERIRDLGLSLVVDEADRDSLAGWWTGLDRRAHWAWCIFVAVMLAGASLLFNANRSWSRYTDALGFFYQGWVAGEIAYLLVLVPLWISQLRNFSLRLNPIDPANTASLRDLSRTIFAVTVAIGLSLLSINGVVFMAGLLFRHLLRGVFFISASAWISVIILAGYPYLYLWQIVQRAKHAALQVLEERLIQQYELILNGQTSGLPSIDDTLKLYHHLLESKSSPLSVGQLIGILVTAALNVAPLLTQVSRH